MRRKETKKVKGKVNWLQKITTVIGVVLCVVFIPLLLINVTLIVKSYTNPNQVRILWDINHLSSCRVPWSRRS